MKYSSTSSLDSFPSPSRKLWAPWLPVCRKSLLSLVLFLGLPFSGAMATSYYVDSVTGSDTLSGTTTSTPWQTITKVNSVTFLPGDNVYFKRGSNWTGTLYPLGNGSSNTSRITFDAYPATGPNPHIDGGGTAYAVEIVNKQYFTFQNFTVSNYAAADGDRIGIRVAFNGPPGQINYFPGVSILNNEVDDVTGITVRSQGVYSTAAINVEFSDYMGAQPQVDSLLIENNDVHDNRCIGIQINTPHLYATRPDLWATNLIIRSNTIDQGGADNIIVNGANAPLIEYNAGYDAGICATYPAGSFIAGMWTAYDTENAVFQYNEVARTHNENINGASGDSQAFDADLGTQANQIFQYNYSHDNDGGCLIMMPDPTIAKTVIFRYNLSVNDGRNTNSGTQFPVHPYLGVNAAYIYNNVFYTTRQEGFKFRDYQATYYYNNIFDMPAAIYPPSPTFSNNCYFGHTPDVTDPYKVLADPKFVGPLPTSVGGDGYVAANTDIFKLQSTSPCINAGMNITAPISNGGIDFWGNPLYAGGYADIGMDEVVGGSAPPPAPVTITDNPPGTSVTYGGAWTHSADTLYYDSTKSVTTQMGNYVKYTFTGTNVSLFGTKGTDIGSINVSIDGGAPVLVDCYWPYESYQVQLYQISGLTNAAHTLKVTTAPRDPLSTSSSVAIDYFLNAPGTPASAPIVTTVDDTASGSLTYTGTWTQTTANTNYYGGTFTSSSTVGDHADFTFTGVGARLYGTKNATSGKLSITIDGGAATVVNCYQPTLPDYQVKLFENTGLTYGTHTMRVTVATKDPGSTANTVNLDCFQSLVSSANPDVIVDNSDATGVTITGTWGPSTSSPGYYGINYLTDEDTGQGTKSVLFTPNLPATGTYQVFARWTALSNRASNVPIDIFASTGMTTVQVNQQATGSQWVSLGLYSFNQGTSGGVLVRNTGANGFVIADAVRFTKQPSAEVIVDNDDTTGVTVTGTWSTTTVVPGYYFTDCVSDGDTGQGTKSFRFTPTIPTAGNYQVFAWWTASSNRASNVPFDIISSTGTTTVTVNQRLTGGQWVSLGTYPFNAGTGGSVLIRNTGANGYVMADAVRFLKP